MRTKYLLILISLFLITFNSNAQTVKAAEKAQVSYSSANGISLVKEGFQLVFSVSNLDDQKVQKATRKISTQDGVKNAVFSGTGTSRQLFLTVYSGANGKYMENLLNFMNFNTLTLDGVAASSSEFGKKFDATKPVELKKK